MYTDLILFDGEKFSLGFDKICRAYIASNPKGMKGGCTVLECDEESIQPALEGRKARVILVSEKNTRDSMHFRKAALNQVTCALAKKNDIMIAFSFSAILSSGNRPLLLGRMMQNIRLCRKYKVKMIFASFARNKYEMRNASDLISFAQLIGMSPSEAQSSLENAGSAFDVKQDTAKGVRILG